MYANTHTEISVREIHPAEVVRLPPHPFRTQTSSGEAKSWPSFCFRNSKRELLGLLWRRCCYR